MLEPPRKFYRLAPGREVRLRAGYFLRYNDVETGAEGTVKRLRCTYDPSPGSGQAPDGRKVGPPSTGSQPTTQWTPPWRSTTGSDGRDPLEPHSPASRELLTANAELVLEQTEPGEVVQFKRLGYFARDLEAPMLFHRTAGLRDEWANLQKRRPAGYLNVPSM